MVLVLSVSTATAFLSVSTASYNSWVTKLGAMSLFGGL